MDRRFVDDSIRRCSTLVQALLAVNSLGLQSGTLVIWNRTTKGELEFEGNQITRVVVIDTRLEGRAALDILVNLRNARCRYLPLGAEIDWAMPADAAAESGGGGGGGGGGASHTQQAGDFESGTVVIARAGFALQGAEPTRTAEDALAQCSTLLEALLAVGTMGVKDGTLEITTKQLTGFVEFHKRKVTRAVLSETGQSGEDALRSLMSVEGATCRYLQLDPQITDRHILAAKRGATDSGAARAQHAPSVTAFSDDGSGKSEAIMRLQLRRADEGVVEEHVARQRAEFLKADPALQELMERSSQQSNGEPPAAAVVPSTTLAPAEDRDAIALARAGFVWDFHEVGSAVQRVGMGDPQHHTLAGYERVSAASLNVRKYLLPSVVAALCVAIYAGPALFWSSETMNATVRRQQVSQMADESYDAMSDGTAIVPATPPAIAPQGGSAGLQQDDTASGGVQEAAEKDNGPDPSDSKEFLLAENAATLPRLEELIHQYIAKRKFRRARDLACAGIRSPYATAEDRQRFFAIYKQCLFK